jgi:hypothetical protein
MPWGAAIAAVGALGAGAMGSQASKNAASTQAAGSREAIAEQQRQFNMMLALTAPQRTVGNSALNQLATLTGLPQYNRAEPMSFEQWSATQPAPPPEKKSGGGGGFLNHLLNPVQHIKDATKGAKGLSTGNFATALDPSGMLTPGGGSSPKTDPRVNGYNEYLAGFSNGGGAPNAGGAPGAPGTPDYSAFYNSPDYKFALDQGTQATERSAAAGGRLRSGNTLAALNDYAQGRATQNFGNYVSRLQSIAGLGASSSENAGQNAMLLGQNVGNNIVGGANARASGIVGSANSWGQTVNSLANIGGNYYYNRQNPGRG